MKNFIKRYSSLIIAIIIVIVLMGLTYLKIKYYEDTTNQIVTNALNYIKSNEDMIGKNIYEQLEKKFLMTDGVVYVNEYDEVALAVVYGGSYCYVKFYDEPITDVYRADRCVKLVELYSGLEYKKDNLEED